MKRAFDGKKKTVPFFVLATVAVFVWLGLARDGLCQDSERVPNLVIILADDK